MYLLSFLLTEWVLQMIVAAKGQQRYLQQVCSAQQGELEAQQTQQHVHSQQDLINVTDRLTAVVQLNAEVLADNSKLTQQLQVCFQRYLLTCILSHRWYCLPVCFGFVWGALKPLHSEGVSSIL